MFICVINVGTGSVACHCGSDWQVLSCCDFTASWLSASGEWNDACFNRGRLTCVGVSYAFTTTTAAATAAAKSALCAFPRKINKGGDESKLARWGLKRSFVDQLNRRRFETHLGGRAGGKWAAEGRKVDKEMWARFYTFPETTGNADEDDRGSLWLAIRWAGWMSTPRQTNRSIVVPRRPFDHLCVRGDIFIPSAPCLTLTHAGGHKYLNCITLQGPSTCNNYIKHMSTLRRFLTLKNVFFFLMKALYV